MKGPTKTIDVKVNPAGLTVAPDGATIWIANSGSADRPGHTVTVIESETRETESVIEVGAGPQGIAFAPGGAHAFVTNSSDGTVSVIAAPTRTIIETVDLAVVPMKFPFGITADITGTRVFVTSAGGFRDDAFGHVAILDITRPTNVTVCDAVAVAGFTGRPSLLPDGELVIVPRSRGGVHPPAVLLIHAATGRIADDICLESGPGALFAVAVTPDGRSAYAGMFGGEGGVWVVDLVARRTATVIPTVDTRLHGVGISPDGRFVAVTNFGAASVSVINTATNKIVATAPVGQCPNDVTITPDNARAFVTNQAETTVSVVAVA